MQYFPSWLYFVTLFTGSAILDLWLAREQLAGKGAACNYDACSKNVFKQITFVGLLVRAISCVIFYHLYKLGTVRMVNFTDAFIVSIICFSLTAEKTYITMNAPNKISTIDASIKVFYGSKPTARVDWWRKFIKIIISDSY